jgi:hypothetical protein
MLRTEKSKEEGIAKVSTDGFSTLCCPVDKFHNRAYGASDAYVTENKRLLAVSMVRFSSKRACVQTALDGNYFRFDVVMRLNIYQTQI